jgi:diaminohydroxyphosphoribosylaminopyrimidine deaminase/5-amino-6-(5-phosphoribosylamino)uracil reductase
MDVGLLPTSLIYGEMDFSEEDMRYMRRALSLAARGKGRTHPNPMVGAVIVKEEKIIGEGYHRGPGKPHAEIEALKKAGDACRGAHLYVNLEPCNHQGRTPPCTDAIIDSGVDKVVMACVDPNPTVRGGGAERLAQAGVKVESGLLEKSAHELNAAYEKLVITGCPLVEVKVAATADGKVAARGGDSKWITGETARTTVHRMRRECDAVMVGKGTVKADDPELTVRMVPLRGASPPLRVVVDSHLSLHLDCRLAQGGEPGVIVATTANHDEEKAETLRNRGVKVLVLEDEAGRVDLKKLLPALGERGVARLLVEGGPTLVASLFEQGLVDRLSLFIAPKVFGDKSSPSWIEGMVVTDAGSGIILEWTDIRRQGEDLLLRAEVLGSKVVSQPCSQA